MSLFLHWPPRVDRLLLLLLNARRYVCMPLQIMVAVQGFGLASRPCGLACWGARIGSRDLALRQKFGGPSWRCQKEGVSSVRRSGRAICSSLALESDVTHRLLRRHRPRSVCCSN